MKRLPVKGIFMTPCSVFVVMVLPVVPVVLILFQWTYLASDLAWWKCVGMQVDIYLTSIDSRGQRSDVVHWTADHIEAGILSWEILVGQGANNTITIQGYDIAVVKIRCNRVDQPNGDGTVGAGDIAVEVQPGKIATEIIKTQAYLNFGESLVESDGGPGGTLSSDSWNFLGAG